MNEVMQALYAHFHEALNNERYDYIEFLLASFDVKRISTEMVVGILMITLSWKEHLPNRTLFFNEARSIFQYKYSPEKLKGLLEGLE
jgi:hypothetical protein